MPPNPVGQGVLERNFTERVRTVQTYTGQFNAAGLCAQFGSAEVALKAVSVGLSPKTEASEEALRALIDRLERRQDACFFQGDVTSLLNEHHTPFFAISYRHDHEKNWARKETENSGEIISNMRQVDQDLLCKTVLEYSTYTGCSHIFLWCDQIISTRLKNRQQDMPWYVAGFLPYATMRTMTLSGDFPANELTGRIWIRAERSLAMMTFGFCPAPLSTSGTGLIAGAYRQPDDALRDLAQLIISGVWPADTGYWANDYVEMRDWALALSCAPRGLPLPAFDSPEKPSNLDLISSMGYLSVPFSTDDVEPPVATTDLNFFLKAYAFNMHIASEFERSSSFVSHYMGRMEPGDEFTWWCTDVRDVVFGMLVHENVAIKVLAVKKGSRYDVYRGVAEKRNYAHNEREVPQSVLYELQDLTKKVGERVPKCIELALLYASDENALRDRFLPLEKYFRTARQKNVHPADVAVSAPFKNLTIKLILFAIHKLNVPDAAEKICHTVFEVIDEWNAYVRARYEDSISVCDSRIGPVWIEGVSNDNVSFGFLAFLTTKLINGSGTPSTEETALPTGWDVVQHIQSIVSRFPNDRQYVVRMLFDSLNETNCDENISKFDRARFLLSGGFTKFLCMPDLSSFLSITAQKMGYVATRVVSRGARVQVRFYDGSEVRMVQWDTQLPGFSAMGLVHPEDISSIREIAHTVNDAPQQGSFEAERGEPITGKYCSPTYFDTKMTSTTTRSECMDRLKHSVIPLSSVSTENESEQLFLVDMVHGSNHTQTAPNNVAVEGDMGAKFEAVEAERHFLTLDYDHELQQDAFWNRYRNPFALIAQSMLRNITSTLSGRN